MIKKIITLLLIISCLVSIGLGIYIDILPTLYLTIFILIELLFVLLSIYLIFKNKKRIWNIFGYIFSFILMLIFICISFIFVRYNSFFNNISNNKTEVTNYVIVVLEESSYYKVDDIIDKYFGILKNDDNSYKEALLELKDKGSFKYRNYNNELDLANGLLEHNVEAILLNEAYIAILNEGINGFNDKIRILDDSNVEIEIIDNNKDNNDTETVKFNNNEAFNIYISGIDTYGKISSVSRSDVNIIATINPNTSKILLTNVPRDMYVQLDGKTGLKDKLTHAGVYGINTSVGTLENFLDIDISYYVRINFSSLVKIVDHIGGVDVYSAYNFKAGNRYYKEGINYNLNGEQALAFSRNRYAFKDGDRQRGRNQQQVIAAIINKVVKSKDINTYFNLIDTLENSFQTNMSSDFINSFVYSQLENNYSWNILFNDVNGTGRSDYTYSYPWQKLYVMIVDNNSLDKAKNMINDVLNGN